MALVFNMGSQARLAEDIEAADTSILLVSYDTMLDKGGSNDSYYAQMINAEGEKEIVLVDVGNSDTLQGLSVTRGSESTSAVAWGAGTIIWQVLSESSFDLFKQKSVDRQVAFNPDGVLVSAYMGEKVFQLTSNLWWKAVAAGTTEWRLIAGEIFVADVVFDPAAGGVASDSTLEMTCATSGTSIYYTADGTDPDETDTLYTTPVSIPDPGPTTFKARAFGSKRYEKPSVNITSGEYTIVAQDWWADKSMVSTGSQMIYSSSAGALLQYGGDTELYERVGANWTLVVAAYNSDYYAYYILEDGSNVYATTSNNRVITTNTSTYPAWSVYISPTSTILNGYVGAIRHIVKFGGNLFITVDSSQTGNMDSGLYQMHGVNSVSLYSRFVSAQPYADQVSPPVECNGSLYVMVREAGYGWFGNLLRLDSGTAARLTTTDDGIWSIFSYNNELYGWGYDGTETYVEIKKFNGSTWVTQKSTYAGTGNRVFYDQTLHIGSVFFTLEGINCDLWRWNPVGDVLENVATNLTEEFSPVYVYADQRIAWDPLDAPATMWLMGNAKTFRWEEA